MNIEVLYFEGCPNHLTAIEMVREILKSLGRQDKIHQVEVRTQADAEAIAFVGSPSIRVNGADIEPWARTAKAFGLSCRTYLDGSQRSGVPSRELLRRAITEGMMDSAVRLATELKDKAPKYADIDPAVVRLAGAVDEKRAPQPVADAVSALINLGYGQPQAAAAIAAAARGAGEGVETAQLIRLGLKELAK